MHQLSILFVFLGGVVAISVILSWIDKKEITTLYNEVIKLKVPHYQETPLTRSNNPILDLFLPLEEMTQNQINKQSFSGKLCGWLCLILVCGFCLIRYGF